MFSGRSRKIYISLGILLMLFGAGGFLFPFLPLWFSSDLNYLEDLTQATGAPATSAAPTASFDPSYRSGHSRLSIPSLGIDMPLFASEHANVLLKGGWVFPRTSTPDAGGNTVIFGHRFRYLPPISNTFYQLDRVERGDEFAIVWQEETYRYRVRGSKIIEPTDLSILAASDTPIVTLITCAPLFSTKQRLVVVADLL